LVTALRYAGSFIAPKVARVAVLRDDGITSGIGQFAVIQSVASPLGWR
jgi:hypothetical protein